jgi:hypothetical protein
MIYEVVNISDQITFEAQDEMIAIMACLLLGQGAFGLKGEDGETVSPILLFANEKQLLEFLQDKGIGDPKEFIDAHMSDISECLASCAVCSVRDRKAMLAVIAKSGASMKDALEAWNEEKRTSLNDICGHARALADHFAKLAADGGAPNDEQADWAEIRRLMEKCVRGSGYAPSERENAMIDRARREDPERYRELHASVKGVAMDEVWPKGGV